MFCSERMHHQRANKCMHGGKYIPLPSILWRPPTLYPQILYRCDISGSSNILWSPFLLLTVLAFHLGLLAQCTFAWIQYLDYLWLTRSRGQLSVIANWVNWENNGSMHTFCIDHPLWSHSGGSECIDNNGVLRQVRFGCVILLLVWLQDSGVCMNNNPLHYSDWNEWCYCHQCARPFSHPPCNYGPISWDIPTSVGPVNRMAPSVSSVMWIIQLKFVHAKREARGSAFDVRVDTPNDCTVGHSLRASTHTVSRTTT